MAAEALRKTAQVLGHEIQVETQGSVGTKNVLPDADIAGADVAILATETRVDASRFAGLPVYETPVSEAIRHTRQVIEAALKLVPAKQATEAGPVVEVVPVVEGAPLSVATESLSPAAGKRLVGITSCPTGIAHTFMAAEALQKAARALGHTIKVETQGSVGAKNQLTPEDIAEADAATRWSSPPKPRWIFHASRASRSTARAPSTP